MGEVGSVRDALIQIVLRLRDDALKDRDSAGGRNTSVGAESLYSGLSMPSLLPTVPSMTYDQRADIGNGRPMLSSGSLYGYGSSVRGFSCEL